MQIVPMRDLKNTVEVEQKVYEAKVIMDGLADVKAGRTLDGESAIGGIRKKYCE